jgi:hypothetical protein
MRATKIIFGLLCFGLGAAFAMGAVYQLVRPSYFRDVMDVALPSMLGGMFLLGSFLLLRPSSSPPASPEHMAELEKKLSKLDSQVDTLKVEAETKGMFDQWETKRPGSKQP